MSLSKELAEIIERYSEIKGNSLTTLSRESGVPYGSVKRISQGETVPEFYNTLKILMVACKQADECFEFIKRHYEDVGDFLSNVNFEPAKKTLAEALADKVSFYIIHLAVARGTTRGEIAELYGSNGLATLESLLDRGLLSEKNSRIVGDNFSLPDINSVLGQVKFLIEDFDASKLGNKKSMASLQIFGLSSRGVAKVYEAQKAFLKEVVAITEEKDHKGNEVMFLATLLNTLEGK